MTNEKTTIDEPSTKNQFGWQRIGTGELAIPVIVRSNGARYAPVRIVEQEIIKKYETLPQNVFQCITLKSFLLTAIEAKLLNNINFNHCNSRYGEAFFTSREVIIHSDDVIELSRFLNISLEIYSKDLRALAPKLGIARVESVPGDPNSVILVPYRGKYQNNHACKFFIGQKGSSCSLN